MFKVSQDIYVNSSDSVNHSKTYGKYQRSSNDDDIYSYNKNQIFVSPEITDCNKIQLLHFPSDPLTIQTKCEFIIKKNGAHGNIETKLVSPSKKIILMDLEILDPDRYNVAFIPNELGTYEIHIKFNTVIIPNSPLKIVVVDDDKNVNEKKGLPNFKSDATQCLYRGLGLTHINLNEKNEFIIDASNAGKNILFIGICGPKGQCDEIVIKHTGHNIYHVNYIVRDQGEYIIVAKWGDEHIPQSPFSIMAKGNGANKK